MSYSSRSIVVVIAVGCVAVACGGSSGGNSNAGVGGSTLSSGGSAAQNGGSGTESGGSSAVGGQQDCPDGSLGCPCYGNKTCDTTLICQADVCAACAAGTKGCACYGNQTCNSGLTCVTNACVELGGTGGAGNGGNNSVGGTSAPSSNVGLGGGGIDIGGAQSSGGNTVTTSGGAAPVTGGAPGNGGASEAGGFVATGGGSPVADGGSSEVATGGASAMGGQSASTTGGTAAGQCASTCSDPLVIDDFEDSNLDICPRNGWKGDWWFATDGKGVSVPSDNTDLPTPIDPPRGSSCGGLRLRGSGFSSWGADVGITFNNPDGKKVLAVDLSQYSGVSFSVRGTGSLRFQVPTTDTQVESGGGTCVGDWPCNDHFGTDWIALTASWVTHKVAFGSLSRSSVSGKMTTTDLKKALNLFFLTPTTETFDLWLDDVSFY